jgi:hypothetical protein
VGDQDPSGNWQTETISEKDPLVREGLPVDLFICAVHDLNVLPAYAGLVGWCGTHEFPEGGPDLFPACP